MSQNEQYDPKVLRKLQLAELEVFKDFIKICDENGLSYFLFAGCAIGVERHKGFIPWDDDIDIGMLRDDYEKVLKIYREKYTDKYVVLDIDSQETFPFYNAEIARIGTKNIPYVFKDEVCEAMNFYSRMLMFLWELILRFILMIMFLMMPRREEDRDHQYSSGAS